MRGGLELDPALRTLIEGLDLKAQTGDVMRAASEWCQHEGVDGVPMLKEVKDLDEEFVMALPLKNAKRKQLRQRLKVHLAELPSLERHVSGHI